MSGRPERAIPVAGLAVGVLAVLPPYVGPHLATEARVEFVDHVVPGVVVLAVSAAALAAGRRLPRAGTAMFAAGLGIVLAGLWMVATHVPLVAQALRDQAPLVATVWHTTPGVMVTAFGALWALRHAGEHPPGPEAAVDDLGG